MHIPTTRSLPREPLVPGEVVGVSGQLRVSEVAARLAGPIGQLLGYSAPRAARLARRLAGAMGRVCSGRCPGGTARPPQALVERAAVTPPPVVATVLSPHLPGLLQELGRGGVRCLVLRTRVSERFLAAAASGAGPTALCDMPALVATAAGPPTVVFTFPDHQWSGEERAVPVPSFGTEILWGVHEAVLVQGGYCGGPFFLGWDRSGGTPQPVLRQLPSDGGADGVRRILNWLAQEVEREARAWPEVIASWWWIAWRERRRVAARRVSRERMALSLGFLRELTPGWAATGSGEGGGVGSGPTADRTPRGRGAVSPALAERAPRLAATVALAASLCHRMDELASVERNLARVYGAVVSPRLLARAHCLHQVLLTLEHGLLATLPRPIVRQAILDRVRFVPAGWQEDLVPEGEGVLILTPHLGSFAVGALALARRLGRRRELAFFYESAENNPAVAYFDRIFRRLHPEAGKLRPTLAGLRAAVRILERGGVVCLMPDVYRLQDGVFFVPFLGQLCPFMGGAAYLWRRAQARVVVGVCLQASWRRHEVRIVGLPDPPPPAIAGEAAERTAFLLTARIAAALEAVIAEAPALWAYWSSLEQRALPSARGGAAAGLATAPGRGEGT